MIKISIALAMASALLYNVTAQAKENTWLRMRVIPTPQFAEMWEKKIDQRVCIVSINVKGEVQAVLLRGVTKELTGVWHIMEWKADSIAAAKNRRLHLQGMYGNMITGMEVASRNYFHDECDGLPPI